jgi:hypothetical protein
LLHLWPTALQKSWCQVLKRILHVVAFIVVVAHTVALFAEPSLVHDHTRAAVKETKERLNAHWSL